MRYSSNATFLVEARRRRRARRDLQAAAGGAPALGLPAGHVVPSRGRRVRAVACARVGHRARHHPARRPARRGRGAALRRSRSRRALLHAARRPRGPLPRVRMLRRARQQHRSQGRSLPSRRRQRGDRRHRSRSHVPRGVEAAHRDLGLRRRAGPAGARRRRLPGGRRPRSRRAGRAAARELLDPLEIEAIACAATVLVSEGLPSPDGTTTAPPGRSSEPRRQAIRPSPAFGRPRCRRWTARRRSGTAVDDGSEPRNFEIG